MTQVDLINFIGNLALHQGMVTSIKDDPSDETILTIASADNISLTKNEIEFIRNQIDPIDKFCIAVQPIVYDGNGGKSR